MLSVEVGIRTYAAFVGSGDLRTTATRFPPPLQEGCGPEVRSATLGELVRPSEVHDLVYELKPNLDTCYYGARVVTNAEGLRAPRSYQRPKPENIYRILLLGDSQTFGQGVEFEETFGHQLEIELNKRAKVKTVEVINGGVDGYNTYQEAAFLVSRGEAYEPDCILILFIGNDLQVPGFMLNPRDPLSTEEIYLFTALKRALGKKTPARVPKKYAHTVGIEGYKQALRNIAEVAQKLSIPVLNYTAEVERMHAWDNAQDWQEVSALEAELGIENPAFTLPWAPEYWLSEDNRHLNPIGHLEITKQILASMETAGVCLPEIAGD